MQGRSSVDYSIKKQKQKKNTRTKRAVLLSLRDFLGSTAVSAKSSLVSIKPGTFFSARKGRHFFPKILNIRIEQTLLISRQGDDSSDARFFYKKWLVNNYLHTLIYKKLKTKNFGLMKIGADCSVIIG